MKFTGIGRILVAPLALVASLAVAPAALADGPDQVSGAFTIAITPVSVRTADGNTFLDYTFTEVMSGGVVGTRTGSGVAVFHPDGSINTENSGLFVGSVEGRSGTVVVRYRGSGSFSDAHGNFSIEDATGGLAGLHMEGSDAGAATGPTTLAGTYTFGVHFDAA
jgi:Protein of unknown function (DUF3224)